jgi:DNA invertase Pin-like site-specific DNA recombinase
MTQNASPTLDALRAARGAGRRRNRKPVDVGQVKVVGSIRVSSEEQAVSGLGEAAQLAAITAECERRGWQLVAVYRDLGVSGRISPDRRPGLAAAIAALDAGQASVLMVAKVDRLARSIADLSLLSKLGERQGWNIVALNAPFDTTTPQGRMMRDMLGLFAELEAAMGSERMKAAAAVRRARGDQLGRPSQVPAAARARLRQLRDGGLSWPQVAEAMNAEGWTTSRGGRWHAPQAQRLAAPGPSAAA